MNRIIKNRNDYNDFLQADLLARGVTTKPFLLRYKAPITYHQYLLRRLEFFLNYNYFFPLKIVVHALQLQYKFNGIKLGFQVPPYTCGPGLVLVHWGSIVISTKAIIGANCRIHSCVNIGGGQVSAPVIGDNVYIGPGAKIFGDITIGDNVFIGANAVVGKSFPANVTIAGVPAKIIKKNLNVVHTVDEKLSEKIH